MRRLTWSGYWTLTIVGVYISALGPGLPSLAARAGVPLAQAGTLFTAVFAGGLITSVGAGRAMDRFGRKPLLLAGIAANGLGALFLSLSTTWPQMLVSAFLLGVGDTMIILGYHVLFSDLYQPAAGSALNRLNVFFGVGALIGPAVAGASLLAVGDIRFALWTVTAAQAVSMVVVLRARLPSMPLAPADEQQLGLRQLLRRPLLWLLALILFLYVGLEVGLGNWTFTYLRSGGVGVASASAVTSGYWLALTLSRAVSPFALRRLPELRFLAVTSAGATVLALALVVFAGWRPGGAVLIPLVGFGFGPVWPLVFAVATGAYRHGAGAASGLLATAGSLGGLLGPWLQGLLLLQHGPHWGMAFTFVGAAGMLIISTALVLVPAAGGIRSGDLANTTGGHYRR